MALFIEGTRCAVCGRPIAHDEEFLLLPPFVPDEVDPLRVFNDAVVHADCYRGHPLHGRAEERLREADASRREWPPRCGLCGRLIATPDEHFMIGHLTDCPDDPL